MHQFLAERKDEFVEFLKQEFPKAECFLVTGSAAQDNDSWKHDSDIDLIVVDPETTRFCYREKFGREIEIHQYSKMELTSIGNNPHWHGANWIFEIGKILGAEWLAGKMSHADLTNHMSIDSRARFVGALALIGMRATHQKKLKQKRAPATDIVRIDYALSCLLTNRFPNRFAVPENTSFDLELLERWKPIFAPFLQKLGPDNDGGFLYFPEHREGARFLIDYWRLGNSVPDDCTER